MRPSRGAGHQGRSGVLWRYRGFLHVLDAADGDRARGGDGKLVDKLQQGGSHGGSKNVALAPGSPVVVNQDVFVGSQDGHIYRVSITGSLKKK